MQKGIWVGSLIHIACSALFLKQSAAMTDFAQVSYALLAGLFLFPCLLLISRSPFMLQNARRVIYTLAIITGLLFMASISDIFKTGQARTMLWFLLYLAITIYLIGYRSYLGKLRNHISD